MLMKKKVDRAMDWLKSKSKDEDHVDLELKDITAMIIAAILVFGPIFLVLGFILYLIF